MTEPYFFQGVVLPERAQLSLEFNINISSIDPNISASLKVSIILNQVAVWVESEHDWDLYDLRNVVRSVVESRLSIFGYLIGYAYDVEITRVVNQSRKVDRVFGIEIPCIVERHKADSPKDKWQDAFLKLHHNMVGKNGLLLDRCFRDLVAAMKHPNDTAFYCYRAIESLRHHCAAVHGLMDSDKSKQWIKFRGLSGCSKETIDFIKAAADPLRHGEVCAISSEGRRRIFEMTWGAVDGYLINQGLK